MMIDPFEQRFGYLDEEPSPLLFADEHDWHGQDDEAAGQKACVLLVLIGLGGIALSGALIWGLIA